jgi:peptide deformylase
VSDHDHGHDGHLHDDELDDELEGLTPEEAVELAARRRIALSQVRQYGDPVLRMRAGEVTEVDGELRELAERMLGVMHDAPGVGLAATQVGIVRRFFVCTIGDEDLLVVNPSITKASQETEVEHEGCLSLGDVRVPVERPVGVTLAFVDADGVEQSRALEGLDARVVQHELDHLDGTLIIDRTDPESRREALRRLRPRLALR